MTRQLTDVIKEASFDCYLYGNKRCVNFGNPSDNKFSYVPEYSQQQTDATAVGNKTAIQWTGKPINIAGVDYIYKAVKSRKGDKHVGADIEIYDKASYLNAIENADEIPLQVGVLETDRDKNRVFRLL